MDRRIYKISAFYGFRLFQLFYKLKKTKEARLLKYGTFTYCIKTRVVNVKHDLLLIVSQVNQSKQNHYYSSKLRHGPPVVTQKSKGLVQLLRVLS